MSLATPIEKDLPVFALFAGRAYYPDGGIDDLVGLAETVLNAQALLRDHHWAHVVDLSDATLPVMARFNRTTGWQMPEEPTPSVRPRTWLEP